VTRRENHPHAAVAARYLTAGIPGIGGVLKERPEDFLVDEVPLYTPSGDGEHLYLIVQKREMSTLEMVSVVARHFGVPTKAVGYAGLKDKHAITRQSVSVYLPGRSDADLAPLEHDRIAIAGAERHTNKLRPGHLRGNRFSIRVRGVEPTRVRDAHRALMELARIGAPNRVGLQRFGLLGNNHLIGRAIIRGEFDTAVRELLGPSEAHPDFNREARDLFARGLFREAIRRYPMQAKAETRVLHQLSLGRSAEGAILTLDETTLRFWLTAFQSAVFNAVLDERIEAGTLAALAPGDVAIKHDNLAAFTVDDATAAAAETPERLASFSISPSGPMWAASMLRASGATAEREAAALARFGVTTDALDTFDRGFRYPLEGKRRPLRVPIIDPEVEGGVDEHGPYVRCAFELPRGAFATVVMDEIMKNAAASTADEGA